MYVFKVDKMEMYPELIQDIPMHNLESQDFLLFHSCMMYDDMNPFS